MKQAKRILSLLLAVMMTLSLATFSAEAAAAKSDREQTAQVLSALGLFKGYDDSGTNFGLSDAAPREQSLIFLIRILGEEKAAKAWTGAQPYNDVTSGNYYYSYIGYAKEKGYTNGIGSNKFGVGQNASMAQMATFALRGLGYSEAAGDFTFQTSIPFAMSLGMLDSAASPTTFTRGDALDVLDGAVATKVKNQTYTLLEKLISSGAVTQAQVDKAAAIVSGTTKGKSDIPAGTYTLRCMGNDLRIVSDKLVLQNTSPAQKFTITAKGDYSYIRTAEGDYVGVTGVDQGTQPVLGTTPYSWLIQKISTGVYTLRPAEKPEMLVCSSEASDKNGAQMLLWPHSDNAKHGLITFTDATKNVAVTGIKLDQTAANLAVGKKLQLTGSISPANASNQTVTWTSGASSVAQVNSDGLVTAMKAGTATITAKTIDGSKTATCKVTVTAADAYKDKLVHLYNSDSRAATDIRISSSTDENWGENLISEPLQPGTTVDILVPVSGSDYVYDMAIAYADGAKGTFVGYNFQIFTSGNTLYTFMVANKLRLTITKPISNVVLATGITVDKTSANLTVGDTLQLKATIAPANATSKAVLWSSNTLAAKVDGNGLVTALKPGTAFISAKTADGARVATCTVTVTAAKPDMTATNRVVTRYNAAIDVCNALRTEFTKLPKQDPTLSEALLTVSDGINTQTRQIETETKKLTVPLTAARIAEVDSIAKALEDFNLTFRTAIDAAKAEASKPSKAQKTITIVNKTGIAFSSINMCPNTAASYDHPVSNSNLKQGESVTVTIDFTGVSLVWDMQIVDTNRNYIEFKNIDFTNCPATGGTITLNWDGTNGTAKLGW